MRKIIFGLMLAVLMCGIANAAVNELEDYTPHLFITLLNQEPDPVEPGKYVDLRFKIENYGTEALSEVAVELAPEYPFSLVPGEKGVRELGTIGGRQKGKVGIIERFRLVVDKSAVEGKSEIKIKYRAKQGTREGSWAVWDPFNVSIRTQDAILLVKNVASEPAQVAPGEMANISITISNLADNLLKDIQLSLNLERELRTTTTVSYEKFPFAPIGSSNQKAIKQLSGGEEKELSFVLVADSDAESNAYKIPLTITYVDNTGKNYTRDSVIGLVVGGRPELNAVLEESEIKTKKSSGNVRIKVINKGAVDSKFVYLKLKESDEYEIIGKNLAYLGNIDSDDYETAEFELYLKKDGKAVKLPLELEYRDQNNNAYSEQLSIALRLYTKSELKRYGISRGSRLTGFIIFAAIVAAGLFIYRKWKRRRKRQNAR